MPLYVAEKITHDNTTTNTLTIEPRGVGYQMVNLGGTATGGGATSLVGVTTYTASVAFNGTAVPISILGSSAATFTTLLAELNTDLGVNGTATLENGNIKITAASASTLVAITAGTLFAAPLAGFIDIFSPKKFVLWSAIPERNQAELDTLVALYGGTLPLAAQVGYQIANFGGTVVGGNATGLSAVNTAGYQVVNLGQSASGSNATGLVGATTYTATITVDTVGKAISVLGSAAQTFDTLITEINTDLAAAATVALVNGNLVVTSATTGTASTVAITAGTLFAAPLAGFVSVLAAVDGTNGVPFTATVTIDGVAKAVSVTDAEANTFTNLITAINTDLGAAGTASISGGNIKIVSATTPTAVGGASTVVITAGTLFSNLTGFVSINATVPGVYNFEDALIKNKSSNGVRFIDLLASHMVLLAPKPATEPRFNPANVVYHDGSVWRFYATDAKVV